MDLINLLPPIYDKNKTMKELQGVLSDEVNKLASNFDKTIDQCFVDTATDLLSRYEKIYGLSVDVTKSNTFRRERIKARAKGIGTVTKKMLEEVAASYSNGDVEVIENFEDYSFIVKFVGVKGIPANMADLTLTIEEIKPAHLAFTFEYTYNTWNDIEHMTWSEASAYTWNQLRVR
jgi:uncharacterized protein YmfQ (DUF2313 family)